MLTRNELEKFLNTQRVFKRGEIQNSKNIFNALYVEGAKFKEIDVVVDDKKSFTILSKNDCTFFTKKVVIEEIELSKIELSDLEKLNYFENVKFILRT